MILLGITCYLLIQGALGVYVLRFISSERDYLLAGRSLGFSVSTLSIFATWFGAETCIGASGRVYESGLSGGRADPFGYFLCLVLFGLFMAKSLWRADCATLGDLIRRKLPRSVEILAVILMVPTSLLWAAAQMRAFGQVLAVSSGLSVGVTLTLAAVLVTAYTALGGLLADALSDTFQGVVLILGMLVLGFLALGEVGGLEQGFSALEPSRLNIWGNAGESVWVRLDQWAVPIIGSLAAQELASRATASRSAQTAWYSTMAGALLYLVIGTIPLILGLWGPLLLPGLDDSEQYLPLLAFEKLSPLMYIFFAGALISAVLSTIDSALLSAGSLVAHNLLPQVEKQRTEPEKLIVARRLVVCSGLIAYALALSSTGIFELVETASSFGSAGLVVVIFAVLHCRTLSGVSAGATLLVGALFLPFAEHALELEAPYLASVGLALITFLLLEGASRLRVPAGAGASVKVPTAGVCSVKHRSGKPNPMIS